tara:strand:- start:1175 stop:1567 length:393 start_codon:yes stop_codon:yes gene_type:complete
LKNWLNHLEPTNTNFEIGVIQLAWLGDAVWELHQRLKYIKMPAKSKDLHLSVVENVKANSQAESLNYLEPLLNDFEIDLVRRARNKTKKSPKSIQKNIYAKSTGFETLIGWLFLNNPKRLSDLFNQLELK